MGMIWTNYWLHGMNSCDSGDEVVYKGMIYSNIYRIIHNNIVIVAYYLISRDM